MVPRKNERKFNYSQLFNDKRLGTTEKAFLTSSKSADEILRTAFCHYNILFFYFRLNQAKIIYLLLVLNFYGKTKGFYQRRSLIPDREFKFPQISGHGKLNPFEVLPNMQFITLRQGAVKLIL